MIALDRPGMGLSDYQPRRTLVNWPDDVIQLAAAIGSVYVVVTIGMFFNPALRGMDVRREPVADPTDVPAAAHHDETRMVSRTTDIH
jgi:hypothetical protein